MEINLLICFLFFKLFSRFLLIKDFYIQTVMCMNTLIVKNYNGVKETPIALYLIGILNFKKYRTKTLLWQQDSSPKNIALASSLGHIVQVGWRTFVKFFTKKSSNEKYFS